MTTPLLHPAGARPGHPGGARPGHPAGARLRGVLAQATPALRRAAAAVWQEPGLAARYPAYLRAMHGVIRASVPLMELAAARCAELPADPVARPLRDYLLAHVEEERGHDAWLLDDLAALGLPWDPAHDMPSPQVARLAGAPYYGVLHHHPVTLLGYIAVLEGNAPSPALEGRLVAAGVPRAATRTVREHAELDTGHTEEVLGLVDALPLSRDQARAVTLGALGAAESLMALFAELARPAAAGTAPPSREDTP